MKEAAYRIAGEEAMVAAGRKLGQSFDQQAIVFLEGDLGVGKTTLTRGVLQAFDYHGAVKSPTYTLVEPYQLANSSVYHFDLYRLSDPEELEYMGIRDYLTPGNFCLIEWPKRGEGVLPEPDLLIQIAVEGTGRLLQCQALSEEGERIQLRFLEGLETLAAGLNCLEINASASR